MPNSHVPELIMIAVGIVLMASTLFGNWLKRRTGLQVYPGRVIKLVEAASGPGLTPGPHDWPIVEYVGASGQTKHFRSWLGSAKGGDWFVGKPVTVGVIKDRPFLYSGMAKWFLWSGGVLIAIGALQYAGLY